MATVEKIVLRDGESDTRSWRERIVDGWSGFKRSFTLGPYNPKDRELARIFGSGRTSAGVTVNPQVAMSVSPFFCAVSTISADLASLPLHLYRGQDKYTTPPLSKVLHSEANPQTTSYMFRQSLFINMLVSGNGYAEIERDNAGRVVALWNIDSSRVQLFFERGRLLYRIDGGAVVLDSHDIIHLRGVSPDAVLGVDMVSAARTALGLCVASENFAASFFQNGSQVGGVLTAPNSLTDAARKNLTEAVEARHKGSDRAHRLMLLEGGITYAPTAVNARDSQFQELRTFQLREVARFFKIPVSLLGDHERSTYSNSEQMRLDYYASCLRPHAVNFEQELMAKLISPLERNTQSIRHSFEGFLRASSTERAQFYQTMVQNGLLTPNEIRQLEDRPPMPGGDDLRIPMNTTTLVDGGGE